MDTELLSRPTGPPENGAHVPRHLGLALVVIAAAQLPATSAWRSS